MEAGKTVHRLVQLALVAAAGAACSAAWAAPESAPFVYVSGDELLERRKHTVPNADDEEKINNGKLRFFCSKAALAATGPDLTSLEACDTVRRISAASTVVNVARIVVATGNCSKVNGRDLEVQFTEEKRQTLLASNLKELLEFALQKVNPTQTAAAVKEPFVWCVDKPQSYTLRLDRAKLTITAQYVEAKGKEEKDQKPVDQKVTVQMITGPEENWFLTGDALVNGAKELKWDAATKTLVSRDKPEQLYLGFNYMFGDVYAKHDAWDRRRIVLKAMFQPSKKPFDSVGLAVGYRFADGGVFAANESADSGGFMVFAGAFWTRADQLDPAGAVIGGKRERSVRFGVSYSLGTLLDWIK